MPYELLGGVEPCAGGWLVVSGRLVGTALALDTPKVFATFRDVVDWKPAFQIIAVHAPLGLPERATRGGRGCDRAARQLLGRHHWHAVRSAPIRAEVEPGSRVAEVAEEMAPYWQRTLFEVNPELSFRALNGYEPLSHSRGTAKGFSERCQLLDAALPGLDHAFDGAEPGAATARQMIDAAANLWTARRIRARAAVRIPDEPDWDDRGIRMEMWH